ncbi:MAG: DUF5686 and carboxypeptidase regulatory-like domain-containing protein [Bacteroidales bacterium]|jgi:hypothetical protein|nr:DUF5686 and carboxypeptidase regulatory-like domain-containing protein [Bacteroidales bacterium]
MLLNDITIGIKKKKIVLALCLIASIIISLPSFSFAQVTKVKGRVTDAKTGEPIPFASVFFKNTTIGVSTDLDGYYTMETRKPTDGILCAMIIGYDQQEFPIVKGGFKEVNFALNEQITNLNAIVVKPDDHYVRSILQRIDDNKYRNDPEQRERYDCGIYSKMELDLTNADEQIKSKLLRKNFGFVFNYMDTSVISGQPYLPVMISEANSHFYHQKNPVVNKEVIKASKISGIKDEYTLAQFTGNMNVKTNFYDNYINIFGVQLPSPISSVGNVYYNYYLIDSTKIGGRKTYKIRYHPSKLVSSPVFDGEMSIDAQDFALKDIHAKLKKGSNVNWIRDLVIDVENERVAGGNAGGGKSVGSLTDSVWFFKQDKVYADFSVTLRDSSKMISFLGRRQVDYLHPRFDTQLPDSVAKINTSVIVNGNVLNNDESYWDKVRPYALTTKESNIYKMVDSIKNVPLYRNIYTVINTIFNGYYDTKYVGFGPYFKIFSFNNLEGARFQMGARTNDNFSKKWRFMLYGAYGTKDQNFKGGGTVEYMFSNQPTKKITLSFKHDALQLGKGIDAFTEGNILSSVLAKGNSQKLSPVNDFSLQYLHEWRTGFDNTFAIESRRIYSNKYVPMFAPDSTHISSVAANQFHYTARFSWNETVTRGVFDKQYMFTKFPVITIDLIAAVKGLSNNSYSYFRTEGKVEYNLQLPPVGVSNIQLSGGRIIGKVPYPLLKLHEGNGTYFHDATAFTCMDFYEFASDTWVTLFYEHNFKGFFLGKIPLLKRLQWREIFTYKAAYGTLSKRNNGSTSDGNGAASQAEILFPEKMSSLSRPYMEAGVGISNIFRMFRVDATWRLTHRYHTIGGVSKPVHNRFALTFGIELRF